MRVVTIGEMKEIEAQSIERGLSESLIIENVGVGGADFVEKTFLATSFDEVVVLVGKGNNGADALSMARHLHNREYSTRVFLLFDESEAKGELLTQLKLVRSFGLKINEIKEVDQLTEYFVQTGREYVVIDGLLGTGFRPPLSNFIFDVVSVVNLHCPMVVSIDIPSGVSAESGSVQGTAIVAEHTLCIGLPKIGLYLDQGSMHSGEISTISAGLPRKLLEGGELSLLTTENVKRLMTVRNKFDHKNRFGHTLVIGGSPGLTGALLMCSEAALKVGTGLVTAATWKESYPEVVTRIIPEIMTTQIPVDEEEFNKRKEEIHHFDSIIMGPGLGLGPFTRDAAVEVLSRFEGPVVVDADAIRVLSLEKDAELVAQRKSATVFTPHLGEFAHFCGISIEEVASRPLYYLKDAVEKTNACIVLKGACTYIGIPSGEVFINYFPNDGMASGGSGDVLAGMIGGLLAQVPKELKEDRIFRGNGNFYKSVCLAVVAHSLAGKYAAREYGKRAMTARMITFHLTEAFNELEG